MGLRRVAGGARRQRTVLMLMLGRLLMMLEAGARRRRRRGRRVRLCPLPRWHWPAVTVMSVDALLRAAGAAL